MKNKVSESHRKELLKFLLVKTAGVRLGIKPGELLRVQHCYTKVNKDDSLNVNLRVESSSGNVFSISTSITVEMSQHDVAQLAPAGVFVLPFVRVFGVAFLYSSVCQADSQLRSKRGNKNAPSSFTSEAMSLMVHT